MNHTQPQKINQLVKSILIATLVVIFIFYITTCFYKSYKPTPKIIADITVELEQQPLVS